MSVPSVSRSARVSFWCSPQLEGFPLRSSCEATCEGARVLFDQHWHGGNSGERVALEQ